MTDKVYWAIYRTINDKREWFYSAPFNWTLNWMERSRFVQLSDAMVALWQLRGGYTGEYILVKIGRRAKRANFSPEDLASK